MSPIAKTSGWPGRVQSGPTGIRPARSHSTPHWSASSLASGDAWTPAAQTLVCALDARHLAVGPLHFDAVAIDGGDDALGMDLHALSLELLRRLRREFVAEPGEDLLAAVEQHHPGAGGVDRVEVRREGAVGQLGDLPGDLDARRPAADDDEGEPCAPPVRVLLQRGHLERAEDPRPQLERVVDRLHARRPARELVVPEVRLPGAGGHDQAVVRKLERRVVRGERGDRAARRGRTRSRSPAPPGCSAGGGARRGSAARSAPPTGSPSPPGRAAAGTGGG